MHMSTRSGGPKAVWRQSVVAVAAAGILLAPSQSLTVRAQCGCAPAPVVAAAPVVTETYRLDYQTVYDEKQVTAYRVEYETVYETKTYTVQKPVWETQTQEKRYTVQRPVWETQTREERYTVMIRSGRRRLRIAATT